MLDKVKDLRGFKLSAPALCQQPNPAFFALA